MNECEDNERLEGRKTVVNDEKKLKRGRGEEDDRKTKCGISLLAKRERWSPPKAAG